MSAAVHSNELVDDDVPIVDPDLRIIDCHHHLWHPHRQDYLVDAFQADINSGHKVISTVYVEASAMYRRSGPAELRCLGEAAFVAGMAAMNETGVFGATRVCEGFVGGADLTLGDAVDDVLEQLSTVSGGRLRGIRGAANWDADSSINTGSRPFAPPDLLLDAAFRKGVACLGRRGLVYDAWQYHPQLRQLASLADALPDVTMVVNHCGGLLRIGPYAKSDTFGAWKKQVSNLVNSPNVKMKLGGLAGGRAGFGYAGRQTTPTAEELAAEWRPYIETCIELLGVDRCMFESNFPVDAVAGSYRTIWNAFKLITRNYTASEKEKLFGGNAAEVYRLSW